ncbi:hypothetical protein COOONC_21277, partial [Cooperia oncophora]
MITLPMAGRVPVFPTVTSITVTKTRTQKSLDVREDFKIEINLVTVNSEGVAVAVLEDEESVDLVAGAVVVVDIVMMIMGVKIVSADVVVVEELIIVVIAI